MGCLISIFLITCREVCFLQRTIDKTILSIHDSSFAVVACLLLYSSCCCITMIEYLNRITQWIDESFYVLIMFQQFNGKITSRITTAEFRVFLQMLLHLFNTILYLMSVVDMDMTELRRLVFFPFINGDNLTEKFLHTSTIGKYRWHHWHSKEFRKLLCINMITTLFCLIKHIESANHTYVHIYQLGCKIEVAFKIRRINHIDNYIWGFVNQLLTHIEFFRTIGRKTISTGEVYKVKNIAIKLSTSHLRIYRHSRIVADSFVCS